MMRQILAGVSLVVAVAVTALWLHAQADDARPPASLLPPGALLYLEAGDFNGLLTSWNQSAEKRRWLASANFKVVSMSRLVERLSQAQDEFAAVAGIPLGMNLADQVAGGQSGFAFYDLAKLSFVYITELPTERVEGTALWRNRTRYESREVAGIPFYVKASKSGDRSVVFTVYRRWFVLATDQEKMAATLVLLSGAKAASLANEGWFEDAQKQAEGKGEIRLVYNLKALLKTPQFRTYWIQRNASELKPFAYGISDLFEVKSGFEEHRTLVRATETPVPTPDASLKEALRYAPADSSLYRAWSMPDSAQVSTVLAQVVSGERPPRDAYNAPAPEVSPEAGSVGSEADLEIRIDEAPIEHASEQSLAPLVKSVMAMQPTALLHVQNTTVLHDQVFVLPQSALVVMVKQPGALPAQVPALQNGPLDPLRITTQGNAIIFARMDLPRGASEASLGPEVTYFAAYNHRGEWPHYKKLFGVIDTHAASPEMAMPGAAPAFFSGNMRSLGDSLSRLENASITSADRGASVEETVRYQLTQQ